jgi:predicted enzyme related to lactoylglutathione lyase
MTQARFESVLIGSTDVAGLKSWYSKAFETEENEMGAFDLGGTMIFIEEHSEVSGPAKEPARIIINLGVDDCRALGKHFETLDATWIRKVEEAPFGVVGTVADPDGNYLNFIQWGGSPESHKEDA